MAHYEDEYLETVNRIAHQLDDMSKRGGMLRSCRTLIA